jgi:ferrous iron transport protein A
MMLPLCQLPIGMTGRVHALTGDSDFCQRVRELGFGEFSLVKKLAGVGPFVCQVNGGARIALGHGVAAQIVVAPLETTRRGPA